ncbi:membrane protein [Streptococcus varani]|uniref:Membrane protein n=1 Tax=Streptococcus varani TaxID=1608583 RepID=A0A0E4H9C3_9STRE|nr:anti sigma factor C-terminal domain-containing protein [Streptococcus varani]CQR25907.1 membrane protein [Streptococcus varani]
MKNLSSFEQIAKKNKRKHGLKLVVGSCLLALIAIAGIYYSLEKLASKNAEKAMEHYMRLSEIAYPNIDYISWGYQATSHFSGNFYSNRVKDIDGIMVPFEKYTGNYSLLLTYPLNQDEHLKSGDGGKSDYTYGGVQKIPIFYNKNAKEPVYLKSTHDLDFIPQMSGQAVEVAITFDKPYTLAEIEKKVPDNLKLNWIWIGQDNEVDFSRDLANQFGFRPYFDRGLEAEEQAALNKEIEETMHNDPQADISAIYEKYKKKIQVNPLEGMQNSFSVFQDNLKKFLAAGYGFTSTTGADGKTYSTDQYLKDYLEANQDPKTATFAGVILTGRAENFAQLENADWIYASNIGQSVQIQPYHQLEK